MKDKGLRYTLILLFLLIIGGEEPEAAFGASAITGEGDFAGKEVDTIFLNKAEGLGRRVAEMVLRLK